MSRYTLVPSSFFSVEESHSLLSELVQLEAHDTVKNIELPEYEAVLVYCPEEDGSVPPIKALLDSLSAIQEYNKVAFFWESGREIHLTVALSSSAGTRLLLANSFKAADFVTAEYFIFAALKEHQINPEMTTIYYKGELPYEHQESLFRYFKGVEQL